jgi:hypothetical protein
VIVGRVRLTGGAAAATRGASNSLFEAQLLLENWLEYNHYRPHQSLNDMTPAEYAHGSLTDKTTRTLITGSGHCHEHHRLTCSSFRVTLGRLYLRAAVRGFVVYRRGAGVESLAGGRVGSLVGIAAVLPIRSLRRGERK